MSATPRSRAPSRASTRAICALSLLALVACDGPTLNAGSYLLEPDASAVSDARVVEEDDDDRDDRSEEDAGRGRDAGLSDAGEVRYPWSDERRRCMSFNQCANNRRNVFCSQQLEICVECLVDEHCQPYGLRCNEMLGLCRDPDRPRP